MYTVEIVAETLPELDRFPRKCWDLEKAWADFHHLVKAPLGEIKGNYNVDVVLPIAGG